jgi:hypothetical protein
VHVIGRNRQLTSDLPLVANRRLMLPRKNPIRSIQPDRAGVAGQRARRYQLIDQGAVERRTGDEQRIAWQLPPARSWIRLHRRKLRHERTGEHTVQRIILEAIDPLLLVEDAVPAANDRRRIRAVGEPDAGLEIVPVDWIRIGVREEWIPILTQRRDVDVIPEAKTQGEMRVDLPLVLREHTDRVCDREQLDHLRHADGQPLRIGRRIGRVERPI